MASTVTAAKAAILTALNARPALAGVSITRGGPTETEDVAEEMIYLSGLRGTAEWKTLGAGKRHESYAIELHVVVIRQGDDEQSVDDRAEELRGEVNAALDADKFLGGLLYTPAAVESWENPAPTPTPDGWSARIVAQVRCEAMFTP